MGYIILKRFVKLLSGGKSWESSTVLFLSISSNIDVCKKGESLVAVQNYLG